MKERGGVREGEGKREREIGRERDRERERANAANPAQCDTARGISNSH